MSSDTGGLAILGTITGMLAVVTGLAFASDGWTGIGCVTGALAGLAGILTHKAWRQGRKMRGE